MKTRMNRLLGTLLAAVMLLSLLPTAALAAKPLLVFESVVVEGDRIKPILGETAVTAAADIHIKTPSDERLRINPDRNARYWKYSADGKTNWTTYYPDAGQTAKFIPGYWQCVLGFWLDNSNEDRTDYAVFGDPCVVTVNGVGWSCTTNETGLLISAKSPVFVLDSDGDLLTEVSTHVSYIICGVSGIRRDCVSVRICVVVARLYGNEVVRLSVALGAEVLII